MKNRKKPEYKPIAGEKRISNEIVGFWVKILESRLLVSLVACFFTGSGLSLALLEITDLSFSYFSVFGFSLIVVVMIALLVLRWWILLSGLGAAAVCTVVYHLIQRSFDLWVSYWVGFINWVLRGAPYHEIYSTGFSEGLLQFLIIMLVLAALYFIIKHSFLFPLLIALSTGILIFSYFWIPRDMTVVICTGCIGLIILFPGVYARFVGKSGETDKNTKARLQIVAIPAGILAVLLALWITPDDTRSWQSRTLVILADDLRHVFRGPLNRWPSVTPNFSMYDMGFQAERSRLGGPVTLSDDTVLLVESPADVLLKGRVYDVYTGSNWEVGRPDGDFRFGSILWQRYRREALGQDRPLGRNRTVSLYNEISRDIDITVTHTNNRYQVLFTTGRIQYLRFSPQLINPVAYFNMRSEIYMHMRMPARHGIILRTRVWENTRSDFTRLFLELEAVAENEDDTRYETLRERYTALPDDLPEGVRTLTAQITANDDTPYSKIISIVAWLNENSEYSLEPDVVPENEDFVYYFLKTGVGYCTYFASALAVMARCEDIPSRYVTGFALEQRDGLNKYAATGETVHAWTELYFKGIGWVEVDPLRWNPSDPLNHGEYTEIETELPEVTITLPGNTEGNRDNIVETADSTNDLRFETVFWSVLSAVIIAIALVVLLQITIKILMKRKFRQFSLNRVINRTDDNFDRLEIYYLDIFKQLALLDMNPFPGETTVTYPARVDDRIKLEKVEFATVAKSVADFLFAGIKPTMEQLEEAYRYHKAMENFLLEWLGKWVYLIKRAIR